MNMAKARRCAIKRFDHVADNRQVLFQGLTTALSEVVAGGAEDVRRLSKRAKLGMAVLRIDEINAYPTHTGYVHALAGESNDLPAFADQNACETGPNDPASSCDDGHPSAPVRSQRLQVWLHFNSFLG